MEIIELQRLAAASLAYIHWNREDVDSAVHYLEQSLKNVGPHDYSILCRCGLVIGEILGMSRRNDLAQPWLSVARDSAMAAKDDASISALAFNLASVSLMLIRQSLLRESSRIESVSAAAFRVLASNNVDSTFGIPRDQLNAMHRARLYSLEGKLREAIAIYRHTPRGNLVSRDRQAAEWTSDEAWCYARLGDLSSALRLAHESEKLIVPGTQIDDLAAMHSRLGLIYKMSGDNQKRVSHESISRSLWLKYEEFQDHCLVAIERIDSPKKVLKWLS